MRSINATQARKDLYRLIDEVQKWSEVIEIRGPRSDAVLISAEEWRSIQETLYLSSIPGMVESIKEGMAAPLEECVTELDWD
jgi:antitoxin YefM